MAREVDGDEDKYHRGFKDNTFRHERRAAGKQVGETDENSVRARGEGDKRTKKYCMGDGRGRRTGTTAVNGQTRGCRPFRKTIVMRWLNNTNGRLKQY